MDKDYIVKHWECVRDKFKIFQCEPEYMLAETMLFLLSQTTKDEACKHVIVWNEILSCDYCAKCMKRFEDQPTSECEHF